MQGTDFGLVVGDILSVVVPGANGNCTGIAALVLPFNFTCIAPSNGNNNTLPFRVSLFLCGSGVGPVGVGVRLCVL